MVSGDRACLAPGPTQRRLMQLSEGVAELHVVVPASAHRQQLGPNVFVYGSGGSSRIAQWLATVRATRQLIRKHRCNLVTAQDPFELGLAAYVASRGTGAKLHLQDHGAFLGNALFPTISRRRRLQYLLGRWLVKRAARVRTVSERGRRGLLAAGVNGAKIDVVPIGTDSERFSHIAEGRRYVNRRQYERVNLLYVGRLEREKGVDVLLAAMRDISWDRDERFYALDIAGDGTERYSLRSLEKEYVLDSVRWLGRVEDVASALERAHIMVVPSRSEGWGMAAIEAAASGLPTVMTDVGCAGEVFEHEKSALIVPAGDPKALADAIVRLGDDEQLQERLASAALEVVRRLPSPQQLLDANLASYQACL